jgi:hypothetical protein
MGMRPKSPLGCRLAENTRQTAWWMRWIRNIGTTAENVRLNQLNVSRQCEQLSKTRLIC